MDNNNLQPLSSQQQTQQLPTSLSSSGPSKTFIILIIVILITAFGIGGYFLGVNKSPVTQNQPQPVLPITQPSPIPTVDPTAEWKTYNNEKYGFSLKYPSNWFSNNCDGFEVLRLDPKDQLLSCASEPSDSIVITTDTAKTEDEYKNKLENVGFKVTSEMVLSPGVFYVAEKSESAPGPDKFSVIVIPTNKNVILITINDQEYESVAKKILSTFQFTN